MSALILPDSVKQSRLISDDYRKQQAELHRNQDYGVASQFYAPIVAQAINRFGVTEVLDYGAGKGRLGQTLMRDRLVGHAFRMQHYDPAIPDWASDPEPCEMVACIDVLEHIEPHLLDNVLDDLQRLTLQVGVFSVSTVAAIKKLADGRNAHLIIEPPGWWLPKILERFELHVFQKVPDGFFVIVTAKEVEHGVG